MGQYSLNFDIWQSLVFYEFCNAICVQALPGVEMFKKCARFLINIIIIEAIPIKSLKFAIY